jgi:hypothetical protein
MTTLAAFIGGWELLLILGIVLFVVNRRKQAQPPRLPHNN